MAKLVKLVLQAGADVNLVDHSGSSPLMWASHQGNLAIIRHLLSIDGIALDLKNRGGYTALGIATSNKNQQVFELLTQAGA
jgi:ankyrin repeat protein